MALPLGRYVGSSMMAGWALATALALSPSAASAPGDPIDQDASTLCVIMVENQTPDYVMNAIATLHNEGYTFDQSVTLMNHAVNTTCPSIKPLVAETLAQYSQGVLGP